MNTLVIENDERIISEIISSLESHSTTGFKIMKASKGDTGCSKQFFNAIKPVLIVPDEQTREDTVIIYIPKTLNAEDFINTLHKHGMKIVKNNNGSSYGLIQNRPYKKRFIVKIGDRLLIKNVEEIAAFYTEDKLSYLLTSDKGNNFLLDHSLEDLENGLLDPTQFFRINRQYIISIDSIREIKSYPNRRLKVDMKIPIKDELIVSRERVSDFKKWLMQ